MLIRNVVARHHTMLRRDGNAEKFWSVVRRCATGNQLAAVSNIRCRTGIPFVALFGPVYVVPCRIFSALKMFVAFLEDSQHRGRFAASDEKHCENISNVLLGMLNAKCCLSWSKANQTVMPEHLQAEEWFRKQFQIRFVHSSMW